MQPFFRAQGSPVDDLLPEEWVRPATVSTQLLHNAGHFADVGGDKSFDERHRLKVAVDLPRTEDGSHRHNGSDATTSALHSSRLAHHLPLWVGPFLFVGQQPNLERIPE